MSLSNATPIRQERFTKIPDDLLRRPDLSGDAKIVYSRMMRFTRQPTGKKTAEVCGMTYNVYRKALTELIDVGLVARERHGHYRVVLCDTSNVREDTSNVREDIPTRETVERERETTTVALRATKEDDVIIGSYGDAPDAEVLPKPRKGPRPVDKWSARDFVGYFKAEARDRYPGRPVDVGALGGYAKNRLGQGVPPKIIKRAMDAFFGNPALVERSGQGLSYLFIANGDNLITRVTNAVKRTDSDIAGYLDTWASAAPAPTVEAPDYLSGWGAVNSPRPSE